MCALFSAKNALPAQNFSLAKLNIRKYLQI